MKTISKQTIVISVILLLVGVSYSSAISVDTKSTISNNQSKECIECNEISDADLVKVERLLDRVEVYSKLLFVLSRHNPELKDLSEDLSNEITTLKEELINNKDRLICDLLSFIDSKLTIIWLRYDSFRNYFIENGNHLIVVFLEIYLDILDYIHGLIWDNGYYLDCDWIPPWYIPQFIE